MTYTINVHPGLVLKDELEEQGITQSKLARHIRVLPKTINEICRCKRGISAEMAVLLGRCDLPSEAACASAESAARTCRAL